jgi:hypothetical protein
MLQASAVWKIQADGRKLGERWLGYALEANNPCEIEFLWGWGKGHTRKEPEVQDLQRVANSSKDFGQAGHVVDVAQIKLAQFRKVNGKRLRAENLM